MTEYIIAHCVDSVSGVRYDERREEIVRCRDCKKYGLGRRCGWSKRFVTPDGFCSWAERRTNDD